MEADGRLDRDIASRDRGDEQLRRFHRTVRRRLAHALREPGDRRSPTRPRATTSARPGRCARRASPPDRRRSRPPSTKRPRPAAWTRSTSGSRTMRRSSRSPASPIRRRRCANATPRARTRIRLVGPAARAAADARRGRLPRRLGHGHRRVPLPDVRRRGARGAPRATARPRSRRARSTWARAP